RRRDAAGEVDPPRGERGDVRPLPRLQGRPGAHPLHHEAAEDLTIPESAYNAWRITSLSTLPPWVLALAITALSAAVWLSFRGFRSEPAGGRRIALLAFRLAAALLVLVLLLEPGIELRAESRVRARVALLFDTSRSMKFPASPSGPTRAEELRRWAAQHQDDLAALGSRFQIDAYGFDKELQPA